MKPCHSVAQTLGLAAGFVAQVVPAALGARAQSLKDAGRPEVFSRGICSFVFVAPAFRPASGAH
jgi:hypothetical protein